MKKYIYILAVAVAGLFLASCTEKVGTVPGNDAQPVVTVFNYNPTGVEYDTDTDQRVRFVNNGKATEAYYFVDKTADKAAAIEAEGEAAYIEKAIAQGKAITFDESGMFETVITGMTGTYDITSIAVNGSQKVMRAATFKGIPWDPSFNIEGVYTITQAALLAATGAAASYPAVLQRNLDNPNMYRIKGAFGQGSKLTFTYFPKEEGSSEALVKTDKDGDSFTVLRVDKQDIPTLVIPEVGPAGICDVGLALGDDSYITDMDYECGMYEDYYCFFQVRYYCSAGNIGWGWYDNFTPNEE